MVHVQFRFVLGHQMVAVVEVAGMAREPRVLHRDVVFAQQRHAAQGTGLPQVLDQLQEVLAGHGDLDQHVQLVAFGLGWTGLQMADDALMKEGLDG